MQIFLTKKYRLCLYKRIYLSKRLVFAHLCERNFEVGRRSRVGALEITTFFPPRRPKLLLPKSFLPSKLLHFSI